MTLRSYTQLILLAVVSAAATPWCAAQQLAPGVLPPPGSGLEFPTPQPSPASDAPATSSSNGPPVEPLSDASSSSDGAEPDAVIEIESSPEPVPLWYEPDYWFGPVPWDIGFEFGLNGSEGNNNVLSLRSGGHFRREAGQWKFDASLQYNKNHTNGVETQNNGKLDVRLDRFMGESKWSLFLLENMIYDEFQAFDIQLSLNTGVGYKALDTETISLLTRFGAGATREYGGVDTDWKPQALFGAEYEHQLTDMQKLVGKVDYFPEWSDFRDYRVVTDISWQIDLDRPENVSLKLSLVDRYDSTPDGAVPNNFDYAALILWKL